MLTTARAARAARRSTAAARAHLSSLTLAPGMAARVDHHRMNLGYIITTTAWWDHPVTGARFTVQDTVPAVAGESAAEQSAARAVARLFTNLRADWAGADQ